MLLVIGRFITITWLLIHHVSCNNLGQNIKWPRRLSPPTAQFGALWLLAFPQTKTISERKEIADHPRDSGKYDGEADGASIKGFAQCFEQWKRFQNCLRSQCTYFEGDRGIILLCTMFLVSCIYFNKCLFFLVHGWILSGQTLYVFIVTSFTLDKSWQQPKCLSLEEWIKKAVVHLHNEILYGYKKKRKKKRKENETFISCNSMYGPEEIFFLLVSSYFLIFLCFIGGFFCPREYYANWNRLSEKDKYHIILLICGIVHWPYKRAPVSLADSCLSGGLNSANVHSQMLCGQLFPTLVLWPGELCLALRTHTSQGEPLPLRYPFVILVAAVGAGLDSFATLPFHPVLMLLFLEILGYMTSALLVFS